ncbi:MAG: hypothetical protein ACE148_16085 [Vicinamibacterales bacterium]
MAKRVFLLSFVALVLLAGCLPAWAQEQKPAVPEVNLTGTWVMSVVTQNGEIVSESTFTQEKETLKVVMTGPDGTTVEGPGTVKEGAIQWSITFETSNGAFTVVFTGRASDADTMAGEMSMGDFGTAAWSAKRKKQ